MMRKLTKQQKQILLIAFKNGVRDYNIREELIERLEDIKYYETISQDIARFLSDCHMAVQYGKVRLKDLEAWALQ
jgi:hypothetical protein